MMYDPFLSHDMSLSNSMEKSKVLGVGRSLGMQIYLAQRSSTH